MSARAGSRSASGRAPADPGFVLLGVVIFVLALTILGLSLFSLSGFETQFLEDSRRDLQALYNATGGLERAKAVIEAQDDLQAVKSNLSPPLAGVDYASAWYVDNGDSTQDVSPVDWSGHRDIAIQVRGVEGDRSRLVEARFTPQFSGSPYRSLIASHSFVSPNLAGGTVARMALNGPIRQNDPDAGWASVALGSHTVTIGGVSLPDVAGFIAAQGPHPTPSWEIQGSTRIYHLDAGGVCFYRSDGQTSVWGFRDDGKNPITGDAVHVTLQLNGTAIWMCPSGAEFERTITVSGSGTLILVAGASTSDELQGDGLYPLGIHIQGGINSPNVPVFLVSDAAIAIDQHRDPDQDLGITTYLSILGASVGLAGPNSGHVTTWVHVPSSDAAILDPLLAAGLLPGASGSDHALAMIPGSWREIR